MSEPEGRGAAWTEEREASGASAGATREGGVLRRPQTSGTSRAAPSGARKRAGLAETTGMRLRLARQARGLSQQQLAGMAGVSRQALSAVEAGHSDPSLRVALALANALGVTVEDLFGPAAPRPPVPASPLAPLGPPGARVALALMGDSFVAHPLVGDAAASAGFSPAGGLVAGPGMVEPAGPPRPAVVVAGCDPALPLLATPLARLDPPVGFTWWACGSAEALRLAAAGLVHVAGAHLRGRGGEYNTGPAREWLKRQRAEVVGFTSWREGLVLRPDLADSVTSLADVAGQSLRLVNREEGSEARRVLDREAARLGVAVRSLAGYASRASGHLQVAAAVAAGLADAGVASEPAALAYSLAFLPLAAERFDLVIPAGQAGSREVQALRKVLASPWLLTQLASLPGYDVNRCGEHIAAW